MTRYFTFAPGLKGPEGQIFNDIPMTGEGKRKQAYLFGPEPIDDKMTLDQAILKFKDRLPKDG